MRYCLYRSRHTGRGSPGVLFSDCGDVPIERRRRRRRRPIRRHLTSAGAVTYDLSDGRCHPPPPPPGHRWSPPDDTHNRHRRHRTPRTDTRHRTQYTAHIINTPHRSPHIVIPSYYHTAYCSYTTQYTLNRICTMYVHTAHTVHTAVVKSTYT